jgi:6-phosphofructokinase 1
MVKKIGVLTSGGDAPGMNAAIRSVTRAALDKGWEVVGVRHGYAGLMSGEWKPFERSSVGGIIQQGGTILGSARSEEFKSEQGRKRALHNMAQAGIDGLIVIGGNGSQTGANALHQMGFPVNGVASTIDNDLVGSDITIGADTALNIALEAIDRLKVTASSHTRAFLLEVMGRGCGYLALMAALAGGAEMAIIPEFPDPPAKVLRVIEQAYTKNKRHAIIVVAEGAADVDPELSLAALLKFLTPHKETLGFELRGLELGHLQRGGAPTAFDRILGTRLGAGAVDAMAEGKTGFLVGLKGNELALTPLSECVGKTKGVKKPMVELADKLV